MRSTRIRAAYSKSYRVIEFTTLQQVMANITVFIHRLLTATEMIGEEVSFSKAMLSGDLN